MGFEHRLSLPPGIAGEVRNVTRIGPIWHNSCLNSVTCVRRDGTICCHRRLIQPNLGEFQECFNSTMRGYTMPAFTFEKTFAAASPRPDSSDRQETARRHRPDPGSLCRGAGQALIARGEGRHRPPPAETAGLAVSTTSPSFRGDAKRELRCAIAHRRIRRFRVWSFGPSRNDEATKPSPRLAQQQAAPAFDLDLPFEDKSARAIGGDHALRLMRQQAR